MSAVYLVVGTVAFLGAVHLFHANEEIGLTKRSSSSYEDTLVRLGHRSDDTSDFDDRIESEHDLSFKINEMLDQVIELGKIRFLHLFCTNNAFPESKSFQYLRNSEALKTHNFDAMLKLISTEWPPASLCCFFVACSSIFHLLC